mgnify:CR=1 FL=1
METKSNQESHLTPQEPVEEQDSYPKPEYLSLEDLSLPSNRNFLKGNSLHLPHYTFRTCTVCGLYALFSSPNKQCDSCLGGTSVETLARAVVTLRLHIEEQLLTVSFGSDSVKLDLRTEKYLNLFLPFPRKPVFKPEKSHSDKKPSQKGFKDCQRLLEKAKTVFESHPLELDRHQVKPVCEEFLQTYSGMFVESLKYVLHIPFAAQCLLFIYGASIQLLDLAIKSLLEGSDLNFRQKELVYKSKIEKMKSLLWNYEVITEKYKAELEGKALYAIPEESST